MRQMLLIYKSIKIANNVFNLCCIHKQERDATVVYIMEK